MGKPTVYHFQPDYAVTPGEVLEVVIESREMSQQELAKQSGMSINEVAAIIDGRSTVTAEIARQLELALGMPAQLWINLESLFQERSARVKMGSRPPLG
ncbi:helix-turn-helix domain-containing protein [Massilia sp. R2A-15]|uniref:helix-turn-helix transcriptional regulator n=1 Tax=Massilia sp. R2A-15 TaxID=3064278 RepID=UPI00273659C1|nr:helix-turn-helix domain-containing protein [Massilia sp. R2A-15]WLI87790.1 helix-turn-helix domain-containing protein [Massilia sp. R2A-15]